MKKILTLILTLCLALCGLAAMAEQPDVSNEIVDGSYVIHIADPTGDLGWLADDMSQDDSVVKLSKAELEGDQYVVQYDPTGDGEVTVAVRHYTGIACDQVMTFDLSVKDQAVVEVLGGSNVTSPDPADQDPYLIGDWMDENQFTQMTIEKNPAGYAWDVEIVSPMTHGAYIFKTTIYYDCELDSFVYDKGKYWEVPITDSDEEADLGEATLAGTTGSFTFAGDEANPQLNWYDDSRPEETIVFLRAPSES